MRRKLSIKAAQLVCALLSHMAGSKSEGKVEEKGGFQQLLTENHSPQLGGIMSEEIKLLSNG